MLSASPQSSAPHAVQPLLSASLGLVVFLGAWLLFSVEPLTGKIITPILGGASEVWIVCLLFFQVVVLGGYFLTYVMSFLKAKTQVWLYVALFALSLMWAHIPGGEGWSFASASDPTWSLLGALTSHLSIPCMILASVSGTMQVWQSRSGEGNPYRLYGLSNLGSFGALLAYPAFIEPNFAVSSTLNIWAVAYYVLFAFTLGASLLLARVWSQKTEFVQTVVEESAPTPTGKQLVHWLFLSTLGSAGLLAFTSYVTTDVAPVPLLWVIPLAIYLLTFAIAFGRKSIKTASIIQFWIPMVILEPVSYAVSPVAVLTINLLILFVLCMGLNAELAESRPDKSQLPIYYLIIAIGGAVGGMLVAIVAPLVFNFVAERGVVILAFTLYHFFAGEKLSRQRFYVRVAISVLLGGALLAWLFILTPDTVRRERNFFGSASVKKDGEMLVLFHGRVKHGQQYIDPKKATIDVYPYGPPAELILEFVHKRHEDKPITIGIIGLGAGSMAIEAHAGDTIDFWEIDPKILDIAKTSFSYLSHSKAKVDVQIGDGRLLLKNAPTQFDALGIDAFSGDAVPVHLLTAEAFRLYLEKLKPGGILFLHITNSYLELAPIVGNAARFLHLSGCELINGDVRYVALCRDPEEMKALRQYADKEGARFSTRELDLPTRPDLRVWTDDFSNLFSVMKWHSN